MTLWQRIAAVSWKRIGLGVLGLLAVWTVAWIVFAAFGISSGGGVDTGPVVPAHR